MAAGKDNHTATGEVTENTPLVPKDDATFTKKNSLFTPLYRVLLCGFLVSLTFGVTQVPLVYIFRVMSCEAYYETHPPPGHAMSDRCSVPEIAANTSKAIALVSFSTTFFGVMNLILTGWTIKRLGVKYALLIQVFWPAVRLAVQNVGVELGSSRGMLIIQCSQFITIVGGPVGYMLALNTYVAELTPHEQRTGALGRLQGCMMLGASLGFLLGGLLSDAFGIASPFRVTLALFLASSLYVFMFLPSTAPEEKGGQDSVDAPREKPTGLSRLFGPLKTFAPQKWALSDGRIRYEYGALMLAVGVWLGVLATGYIPTLLQMYATDIFGFGTTENSYLVSMHSLLRGLFLTIAFPKIIAFGRRRLKPSSPPTSVNRDAESQPPPSPPIDPPAASVAEGPEVPLEDAPVQASHSEQETFEFDLYYTRLSLLIDGVITGFASLITSGWQMYLIGVLLPLGAGTASAAKGTILQMSAPSERTDALSGIALVEMIARLATSTLNDIAPAALC